jgi:hypothetical protein
MPNSVSPRTVSIYQRALICRAFPAYKMHELEQVPIADLLWAMELLATAHKVNSE